MILLKWVIRPWLYLHYFFQQRTKTGTFGKDQAVHICKPYKNTGNFVKHGLFRHHVKQFHASSCSVATLTSVINTLLDRETGSSRSAVTQQDMLENVKTAHWKERMSDTGYQGQRGLPLNILGRVTESALSAYRIPYHSLEIIQARKDPAEAEKIRQTLRLRLEQFEKKGNCIIIAHFDQGSFIQDLHIPHISPVGGFDSVSGMVTLLDVDPGQPCPYQVPFHLFYKGLSYDYNYLFRRFGYGEGGYVFIRLSPY